MIGREGDEKARVAESSEGCSWMGRGLALAIQMAHRRPAKEQGTWSALKCFQTANGMLW